MSLWTGPNDAPLSTKEERMAELAKPKCDHIIGMKVLPDHYGDLDYLRQSENTRPAWSNVFAFCPICGARVATDEDCSFLPTQTD